jgi:hypothetical protein
MAKAIPTPHCAKVFCARKMLRIFLIGRKKPSFTAGTLGESCARCNLDINYEIIILTKYIK